MGLMMVEILLEIEDRFGIRVPDERCAELSTVADMQKVVVELLIEGGRQPSAQLKAEVYSGLTRIIFEQTGVSEADIRPESRWIGEITRHG